MLSARTKLFSFLAFVLVVALLCPALVSLASSKQTITLTVGLSDERKVPNMPSNIGDDLNYNRNVVKISIAKDLKIIRFEPMAVGTTNFILRDDKGKKVVEYNIVVRKSNLNQVAYEIKSLLGDI